MTATCRRLTVADHPAARPLFEALPKGQTLPNKGVSQSAFAAILSHPGTSIFAAETSGELVSMATLHVLPNLTYNARPYALIENVATLPAYERQGYGRAVMTAAADAAWSAGAYKIMLMTGRSNDALGFYTSLGYQTDEKHGLVLRNS